MLRFWAIVISVLPLFMFAIALSDIWKERFRGRTVVFIILGIATWLAITSFTGWKLVAPIWKLAVGYATLD